MRHFNTLTTLGIAAMLATLNTAAQADTLTLISPNQETGGFFGISVGSMPDLDADGVDDVIVGASVENGGNTDAGRAYIYSGRTGLLIRAHNSPNPGFGGRFGTAVAGLPDINGDGYGDYIVGATDENGEAGRAYVYSGFSGTLIRTHNSPNSANFGHFGDAVAGIADLTGDGRGDYIIGAPDENSQRGNVYVYSGSTGNLWRTHTSPNAEIGGKFGFSVAGVPDDNADGRGDYVIGAPYEGPGASPSGAGRAYVYSGLTGALQFTLKSGHEESSGFFGWSVGGVPDVGGNGSGDIIVGAPQESITINANFNHAAGRAYLFSGSTGVLGYTYQQPDAEIAPDSNFGYSVDGMHDRTGDGLGEVVIGAQGAYDVFVFKGTGNFDLLEEVHTPDGIGVNQFFGAAVAGIRDANGDGKGDYIIGGPGTDNFPSEPSQAGRAYIHRSALLNNGCSLFNPETLVNGANAVTNIGASGNFQGTDTCADRFGADVWYRYIATCNGTVTFSTCGTAQFDTVIAVYEGCSYLPVTFTCALVAANPLACNDDTVGCADFSSRVTVPCTAGECFFVRFGGYNTAQGIATMNVGCSCLGDLNGDGTVDGADLGLLLGSWNTAGIGDLNSDGTVNGADLGLLLGHWGACA